MTIDPVTGRFTSPFSMQGAALPVFDPGLIRPRENLPGTRLGRAVRRGGMEVAANIGSAMEGVGVVTGNEALQERGAEIVARRQAQAARSRAMEMDTTTGMLVDLIGEQIPQLAASIGLPLAGAAVGSLAGPAGTVAGATAGRAATGGRALAALAGRASGAGARQGLATGVAASAGFNYGVYAGLARETQKFENERQGLGPQVNEAAAFAAAAPAAALDTMAGLIGGRIAARAAMAQNRGRGARAVAGAIGGATARGAAIEGPTEVGQQAIMRFQANQDLASEEALQEYVMAGFAGAFLGGTIGGAGATLGALRGPAAEVQTGDMEAAIDRALALPPPDTPQAQGAIEGPPAPAGALTAPAPIRERPTEELEQALQQLQRFEMEGQASPADTRLRQIIRMELDARERGAMTVDEAQAEAFPGLIADTRRQDALRLAQQQRQPEPAAPVEPDPATDLFPETTSAMVRQRQEDAQARDRALFARAMELESNEQARRAAEAAPLEATRETARMMGLKPNSKFFQQLEARSYPELVEAVLDGLEMTNTMTAREIRDAGFGTNLDSVLAPIADAMGITRDLPAEMNRLRQERDQFAPDSDEYQLFNRRANDLEQRQQALNEITLRRLEVEQAREVEQVRGQEAQQAQQAQEAQETQRRVAEAAGEGRPVETRMAEQLREMQRRQQRQQEFEAAGAQRREQQAQEASQAVREQTAQEALQLAQRRPQAGIEARSPESVARMQEGRRQAQAERAAEGPITAAGVRTQSNVSTLTLSDGTIVPLERRRTGYYVRGKRMGRNLTDATTKAVEMANRARDGAILPKLWKGYEKIGDHLGAAVNPGPRHTRIISAAAKKAVEGWESAGQVTVVANPQEYLASQTANPALQSMLTEEGFMTRGLYDPETQAVVLFADSIGHPDLVASIVYHEMLGHFGLDSAFGAQRDQLLMDMHQGSAELRDAVELWRELRGDAYPDATMATQIEEAIAMLSEDGPIRATFMQQMRALFIKFARMMGFKTNLSQADVAAMIAYAHEAGMSPRSVQRGLSLSPLSSDAQRRIIEGVDPAAAEQIAKSYPDQGTARETMPRLMRISQNVPNTPRGDEQIVRRLMSLASDGVQKVTRRTPKEMNRKLWEAAMYFQSMGHLVTRYGRMFPTMVREGFKGNPLEYYQLGRDLRVSAREVVAKLSMGVYDRFTDLPKAFQDDTTTLMSMTAYQLDPSKPLTDHAHLTPEQRRDRAHIYKRGKDALNRLKRRGHHKVYDDAKAVMRATYMQQHALDLHDVIISNSDLRQAISSAQAHPMQKYLENPQVHNDPQRTAEFWQAEIDGLMRESKQLISRSRQVLDQARTQDQARIETLLGLLNDAVQRTDAELSAMAHYPYFHLGRFGKHYATFNLAQVVGEDGQRRVDPAVVERVADELAALGYENVAMNETPDGPVVFIRTDTQSDAESIHSMAVRLQQEGIVDPNKPPAFDDVDPVQMLPESARQTVQVLIQDIEAQYAPLSTDDADTRAAKAQHVARASADLQTALLNRLPDMSTAKVMARRKFRAGFDKEFMRSFATRMQVSANAGAERLASSITNDAFRNMLSATRQAREGNPDKWTMNAVTRELIKREDRAPDTMATGFLDAMKAFNHNYFLAFNPGYTTTQIAQLQINLWPELVKGGASWKDSFGAISRASAPATRIMSAVLSDAARRGFARHGADATLTADILSDIQLSPDAAVDAEMKTFLMGVYRRGQQDLGSSSRNLGQRAEGRQNTRFDTAMKWASSYNYHLEVLTRNISALSAYEIGKKRGLKGDGLLDYASTVVRESMLNYREDNRARAFGRGGVLGQFTPLSTAFLTFQHHITEKYVREWGTAVMRSDVTPEERAAARRWLVSHYSAMTALAGTLGLPFVTVAARVLSGIGDWWTDSEEPVDVRIGWRNFLADTFGENVGEVLSRGLPRAAGFDISSRVGAADFFPFSRLIDDRRDWDDSLADFAERMMGAPTSMVAGILQGGQKIASGRVLDGMRDALPLAFRNPAEAVRLTQEGFVDRRGNLLPIEPETRDVIWQALGLRPARRAEYTEANFNQSVRRATVGRQATMLRRDVVRAVQAGDAAALREALAAVRQFDQNVSPDLRIMPGLASAVQQGVDRREVAAAIDQPLGVSPSDLVGREQTRFANFR